MYLRRLIRTAVDDHVGCGFVLQFSRTANGPLRIAQGPRDSWLHDELPSLPSCSVTTWNLTWTMSYILKKTLKTIKLFTPKYIFFLSRHQNFLPEIIFVSDQVTIPVVQVDSLRLTLGWFLTLRVRWGWSCCRPKAAPSVLWGQSHKNQPVRLEWWPDRTQRWFQVLLPAEYNPLGDY